MAQTLSLNLDAQTLARAREAALARGDTLEGLVADVVRRLGNVHHQESRPVRSAAKRDALQGIFSDDPGLMDEMIEAAMAARERDPLRRAGSPRRSRGPGELDPASWLSGLPTR